MIPNLAKDDKDETFSLEIFKHNNVKVCGTINKKFIPIKNHIGDINSLKRILKRIDDTMEKRKDRDDIKTFQKIVKFGFEHLCKACTDEEAKKFDSSHLKITSKNPIRFQIENCPIEYSIEDFFVKYFTNMSKSVSRKTKKSVKLFILTFFNTCKS